VIEYRDECVFQLAQVNVGTSKSLLRVVDMITSLSLKDWTEGSCLTFAGMGSLAIFLEDPKQVPWPVMLVVVAGILQDLRLGFVWDHLEAGSSLQLESSMNL
jgi:hypothetical protein